MYGLQSYSHLPMLDVLSTLSLAARLVLTYSADLRLVWGVESPGCVLLINRLCKCMSRVFTKVKISGKILIGHVNVQSCHLIIFQYQPIRLQFSWLSVEQPTRFRLSVVYASLGIFNLIEDISNVNMPYWKMQAITTKSAVFFALGHQLRKSIMSKQLFYWVFKS